MSADSRNLATLRAYLAALEAGAVGAALAACFDPAAVQVELPNRLNPHGQRADLATLLARAERGRGLLRAQRYELRSIVEAGDRIAVEAHWRALLAAPLGTLAAGAAISAHFAMFFEFVDGRIAVQRNYDCFDPF